MISPSLIANGTFHFTFGETCSLCVLLRARSYANNPTNSRNYSSPLRLPDTPSKVSVCAVWRPETWAKRGQPVCNMCAFFLFSVFVRTFQMAFFADSSETFLSTKPLFAWLSGICLAADSVSALRNACMEMSRLNREVCMHPMRDISRKRRACNL